jgi:ribosomal protein L19E
MASDRTTIQTSKMTRDQLRQLRRKGETYDQVLHRLFECARKAAFFKDIDRVLESEVFVHLDEK